MIVLGGKTLCRHFLAHGETIKIGKTFMFDQLQDPPSMVAQHFTSLFDVFQVKEVLQNHNFSNNSKSVPKYVTLIIQ